MEEIGKNSVRPSTIPKIIVWKIFIPLEIRNLQISVSLIIICNIFKSLIIISLFCEINYVIFNGIQDFLKVLINKKLPSAPNRNPPNISSG